MPAAFHVQDQLIFSAINKQDHETFAIDAGASSANVSKYEVKKESQSIAVAEIPIVNLSAGLSDNIKTSYSFCGQHYDKENAAQYLKGYKNGRYKTKTMDKQHWQLNIPHPWHKMVTKKPAQKRARPPAFFCKKRLKTLPYSQAAT